MNEVEQNLHEMIYCVSKNNRQNSYLAERIEHTLNHEIENLGLTYCRKCNTLYESKKRCPDCKPWWKRIL